MRKPQIMDYRYLFTIHYSLITLYNEAMTAITSRQNSKVKLARSLQGRKGRDESGLFLIEGMFHLGEAEAADAPLEFLLYCPKQLRGDFAPVLIDKLTIRGVDCLEVSADVMDSVAGKDNPQGLLAVARQQYSPLSSFIPSPLSISIALVEPADPGNLGTILRTLDAAGGGALFLLDGGVDAYHPTAVRAGLGAHFWHPILRAGFAQFAAWASDQGVQLIGSSAQADTDYRAARVQPPAVLLLGSEREGLSLEQTAACEQVLGLPMAGRATSLNLAVAAGVLLYTLQERSGG